MKYLASFFLLGLLCPLKAEVLQEFATGYNLFAANVYKELLKTNSGNFVVCPLSADIVLSLANSGARGQTAQELSKALGLPEDPQKVQEVYKTLSPHLQKDDHYTLNSASKVYVKDGFKITDSFNKTAVDVFDAEIQNVYFTQKASAAATINSWVQSKTKDKIKDVISPSVITEDTRTILVNAIYFHGKWLKSFNPEKNLPISFYLDSTGHQIVNMMRTLDNVHYYESGEFNAKFIKLDYSGDEVSMHIILPNHKEGLSALEQKLEYLLVPPEYRVEKTSLWIPKFTIDTKTSFVPILKVMGVQEAFKEEADFSGIGPNKEIKLKIDGVVQKAFIEVEEKGTTAAAPTAVLIPAIVSSLTREPIRVFHADHPFLFYLRLNKPGINFFIGRYKQP